MPSDPFTADKLPSLKGRIFVVTGGNLGIGYATVCGLAAKGAKVYMGIRNQERGQAAMDQIKAKQPGADVHFLFIDMNDFKTTIEAARTIRRQEIALHGLVNNAGALFIAHAMSKDGIDVTFQGNYLGHWLFTYHLLPLLKTTAKASRPGDVRIVNLTSNGHTMAPPEGIKFDDINIAAGPANKRYGQSKLAMLLYAKSLDKRYGPGSEGGWNGEIWTAAVHPGLVATNPNKSYRMEIVPLWVTRILSAVMYFFGLLDSEERGGWTGLFAAASPDFTREDSGAYVVPYSKIATPSALAMDEQLADKLYTYSEDQLRQRGLLEDL